MTSTLPVVARLADDLGSSVLFGVALFPFWGVASAETIARGAACVLRTLMLIAALTVLAGAVGAAILALDGNAVRLARIAAAAVMLALLGAGWPARTRMPILFAAAFILIGIAWAPDGGGAPLRAFHLAAAGIWIGALFVFACLAAPAVRRRPIPELQRLHYALERFAGVGSAAVAILTVTGLLLLGLPKAPNGYTAVMAVKLAMFGAMLILAAANRFWLTPRLKASLETREGPIDAVAALRISLLSEAALGTGTMAAAALLTAL